MTTTGDRGDRERVGKFDWQRLMLLSALPFSTKAILMMISVYMSEDGGNVRPGLDNLIMLTGRGRRQCIDHLKAAVEAGYLEQVERGGYRGAHYGRRASVYVATVPKAIHADSERLLASPPFRRADSEGATGRTFTDPGIHSSEGATGRTFTTREPRESLATASPSEGADLPSEGAVFGSEGAAGRTPSINLPSITSHQSPRPSADVDAAAAIAATGATDDEIDEVIEKIKTGSSKPIVNLTGYVKALAANGSLPALIDAVRADRQAAAQRQAQLQLPAGALHNYRPSPSGDYCTRCHLPASNRRHQPQPRPAAA
ncbi:hypothetical protein [Micromonospora chersina]